MDLLKPHCPIRIKEAVDGELMEKSVVYIAPPDKHLMICGGKTYLTSTTFAHFSRPSIDLMFESVAGSMGIKAIKERGGTTIAQDPKTAEFKFMP